MNASGVDKRPCYLATLFKWETEAAGLSAPQICRLPALPGPWRAASQWEHQIAQDSWGRKGEREILPELAHCLPEFSARRAGSRAGLAGSGVHPGGIGMAKNRWLVQSDS